MVNIVNGHDLDTQSGRADFRKEGGWVEGNSSGGGYSYEGGGSSGSGGGTQTPTQGATYNTGGGSTASPTVSGGNQGGVTAASLDAQYQKMLAALASGNREAFEWEKEQFNRQFAEGVRQYDQNRSDAISQFAQNLGLNVGQLTGMYNGQPTEQRRQFDINTQEARDSRYGNLGASLLDAATRIRGPQDYLQYQQLTRGGQTLLQQLYGNNPIPQFGAPVGGQLQPATLQGALNDVGFDPTRVDPRFGELLGGPGQTRETVPMDAGQHTGGQSPGQFNQALYQGMPQPQVDPRQQILQRFGLQAGQTAGQLLPNQINPARWDAMGQIGRDLTKNLAETVYGYDPTDFERQINATRPIGTARTGSTSYAQPRGLY